MSADEFDKAANVVSLERRRETAVQPEERRFKVQTLSQFPVPDLPKLVHGFIGHAYLVLVYGGWGSGKSFFVIDLLCCIAFGDLWRGRQCDPGLGVYIAGEAPGSIKNRIRAWCLRRGKITRNAPEPPIGVIGCAPDLLSSDSDLEKLIEEIDAYQKAAGLPVRVIAIDTMHSCAPGSKEDAGDTGTVLAKARKLSERFGCAVILVHHSGKDAGRGARGSVSLEAAADVIVEVVDDEVRTPFVRKLRDGELPELEPFIIYNVTFNQDTPDPVHVGVHELTEPKSDPSDPRKAKVLEMRKGGMSYGTIAKSVGIAKSTAEFWCKGKP